MSDDKLDEIAARAFPEADHRAARCRAALDEAVAEERKWSEKAEAALRDVMEAWVNGRKVADGIPLTLRQRVEALHDKAKP